MEVGSREDEEGTAILQVILVCSRARDAVDDITKMDMGTLLLNDVLNCLRLDIDDWMDACTEL